MMQPSGVAVDEFREPVVTDQHAVSDRQVKLQVGSRPSRGEWMNADEFGHRDRVLVDLISLGGEAALGIVLVVLERRVRHDDFADEVHRDAGGQLGGFVLDRCRFRFGAG